MTRRPWDLPPRLITPEEIYRERRLHRRELFATLGLAGIASAGLFCGCSGSDDEIRRAGEYAETGEPFAKGFPAKRNAEFEYGRPESAEVETQRYTNFFEFTTSSFKDAWRYVGNFKPLPWTLEVSGLCRKPRTFDVDSLHREFAWEERCYRHRCVETWAMCVPWTGFPLAKLLKQIDPKPQAKYVRFVSFERPDECPALAASIGEFPWPYSEALTINEAMNELTFVATGLYGHRLPKQNGAPIRLVVPWKYGFKSAKSIVRIELTDRRPETFWNTKVPDEYGFEANVDPAVPHPRWSQRTEWMLGTRERYQTLPYNGYGEYVAKLYL